jgi:hypothetical protein
MREAERAFAARDAEAAYRSSRQACEVIALWRRAAWERAVKPWPSPVTCPLAVTSLVLDEQFAFNERAHAAVIGRNSLVAGECDDLDAMTAAGWKHLEHPLPGVTTRVELSPDGPFAGPASLRLSATSSDESAAATFVETPPVWVTSAPVEFATDVVVRLRARVRVPSPITGSVDGLEIIDSLGGADLAARIGHAPDWQEYTAYRFAAAGEKVTLTFALTGLGDAWIDNVAIEPVALPPTADVRPGPVRGTASTRPATDTDRNGRSAPPR